MHLHIISGILLVVPIVDIALAAPVLVQEKHQPRVGMADIPEYSVTVLGKRVGMGRVEPWLPDIENLFIKPEEPSVADGLSTLDPSEPGHVSMSVMNAPVPNPGPSTESTHFLTGMNTPLSTPVYPEYFHPDNKVLGTHASRPNTGTPNPPTKFNSAHRLVVEEPPPPPIKGSSRKFGSANRLVAGEPSSLIKGSSTAEMADIQPSNPVKSTDPNRKSMNSESAGEYSN